MDQEQEQDLARVDQMTVQSLCCVQVMDARLGSEDVLVDVLVELLVELDVPVDNLEDILVGLRKSRL